MVVGGGGDCVKVWVLKTCSPISCFDQSNHTVAVKTNHRIVVPKMSCFLNLFVGLHFQTIFASIDKKCQ